MASSCDSIRTPGAPPHQTPSTASRSFQEWFGKSVKQEPVEPSTSSGGNHECAACKTQLADYSLSICLGQKQCARFNIPEASWTTQTRVCLQCRERDAIPEAILPYLTPSDFSGLKEITNLNNKKREAIRRLFANKADRTVIAKAFEAKCIGWDDLKILLTRRVHDSFDCFNRPLMSDFKFLCPFGDSQELGLKQFRKHCWEKHECNLGTYHCYCCGFTSSVEAELHDHVFIKHGLVLDSSVDVDNTWVTDLKAIINKLPSSVGAKCQKNRRDSMKDVKMCPEIIIYPSYSDDHSAAEDLVGSQTMSSIKEEGRESSRDGGGESAHPGNTEVMQNIDRGKCDLTSGGKRKSHLANDRPIKRPKQTDSQTDQNRAKNKEKLAVTCIGPAQLKTLMAKNMNVHYDCELDIWDIIKFQCPYGDAPNLLKLDAFQQHMEDEHEANSSPYRCFACGFSSPSSSPMHAHLRASHQVTLDSTASIRNLSVTNCLKIFQIYMQNKFCSLCQRNLAKNEKPIAHYNTCHEPIAVLPPLSDGTALSLDGERLGFLGSAKSSYGGNQRAANCRKEKGSRIQTPSSDMLKDN